MDRQNNNRAAFVRPDGIRSPTVVLTPAMVIEARRAAKQGVANREIAKQFGVKEQTLYSAVTGQTWSYLNNIEAPAPSTLSSERPKDYVLDQSAMQVIEVALLPPRFTVLTAEMVIEARNILNADPFYSVQALAEEWGVNAGTLRTAIIGKKGWCDRDDLPPPVDIRARKVEITAARTALKKLKRWKEREAARKAAIERRLEQLLARAKPKKNGMSAALAIRARELAHARQLDAYAFAVEHHVPVGTVFDVVAGRRWSELDQFIPPVGR